MLSSGSLNCGEALIHKGEPSFFGLPLLEPSEVGIPCQPLSLMTQWLNCCTAAKTVLTTPGSHLKVDSAFYPSEIGKRSAQLAGGGQCVACII